MKKPISIILTALLALTTTSGCSRNDENSDYKAAGSFNADKHITVVSREEGSGTRGAFVELFGIEEKGESGEKVDKTTDEALVTNNTAVMLSTVAGNKYAIGYVSLGSLNDDVKALKIDGVEASAENVRNGSYKIARPFNIAVKENISEGAQDFIDYILSAEGQKIVEENGYISVGDKGEYKGGNASGRIVIAGSSSVTPVMEKLKEAYLKINSKAKIEIQQSDSTTGVSSVIKGICDIGMVSRDLKASEKEKGLAGIAIAMDGIAVIVNKDNIADGLSREQIREIFTGEAVRWSDVIK